MLAPFHTQLTLILTLHLNSRWQPTRPCLASGLSQTNILWQAVTLGAHLSKDKTISNPPPGQREEVNGNMYISWRIQHVGGKWKTLAKGYRGQQRKKKTIITSLPSVNTIPFMY